MQEGKRGIGAVSVIGLYVRWAFYGDFTIPAKFYWALAVFSIVLGTKNLKFLFVTQFLALSS